MKHTNGRWTYVACKDGGEHLNKWYLVLQSRARNSANIAKVIPCIGMSDEEVEANARLIARAPELLLQLDEAEDRLDKGRTYLMGVQPSELTVEDCLEAFGFGRNGLGA